MDTSLKLTFLQKIQLTRPILSLTVMRLLLGHIFVKEGTGKLFGWFDHGGLEITGAYFREVGIPLPETSAALVGVIEAVTGLLLLAGLFTRLAVVPVAIVMVGAVVTVHQVAGYHSPLVICGGLLTLAQSGAGHYSADAYMASRALQDAPYVKLRDRG